MWKNYSQRLEMQIISKETFTKNKIKTSKKKTEEVFLLLNYLKKHPIRLIKN